jgi:hypothetical protein
MQSNTNGTSIKESGFRVSYELYPQNGSPLEAEHPDCGFGN